ncbi:MAG: D-aminoacyl-tRNA deacylase [Anaerolineales bacterium]|jgi:D-tyrosyl-tRNA(Tyr) deacylase
MRAVLQRVSRAQVSVSGRKVAEIGTGYVILLGIEPTDGQLAADQLAEKCAQLRLFPDDQGKTNRSIRDVGGEALVISQFTLLADTHRGRRPSFAGAASPAQARPLYEHFAGCMRKLGVPACTGEFGAHMLVEIQNDGPFTLVLDQRGEE